MRTVRIIAMICLMTACLTSYAQNGAVGKDAIVLGGEIAPKDTTKARRFKNHLIAPKGEWQCGVSIMYVDFSSNNSEFMLVMQDLNASASLLRLAPEGLYTYKDNHAIGARFQYTNINGMVDSMTADLLGNLSLDLGSMNAQSRSMGGSIVHRTYVGLDGFGRVGLFWDYVFTYTKSTSQFLTSDVSSAYSLNNKLSLNFAPGIVYFPMNNVSVQACISMAGVSYNSVRAYDDGVVTGQRQAWKARASLSLLDLSFGVTVHL